jgi:hypothetical protein
MAVLEKRLPAARLPQRFALEKEPLAGAFFWLSAFYVSYCARPEDWIPGLANAPHLRYRNNPTRLWVVQSTTPAAQARAVAQEH